MSLSCSWLVPNSWTGITALHPQAPVSIQIRLRTTSDMLWRDSKQHQGCHEGKQPTNLYFEPAQGFCQRPSRALAATVLGRSLDPVGHAERLKLNQ